MALTLRKGIFHWRKEIEGQTFQRSTRTSDLKTAQTLEALWTAEAIKDVLIKGTKPVSASTRSWMPFWRSERARRDTRGHNDSFPTRCRIPCRLPPIPKLQSDTRAIPLIATYLTVKYGPFFRWDEKYKDV